MNDVTASRTKLLTPRLDLINCDLPLVEAVLQGNLALAAATGLNVPDDWTEFGEPAFRFAKDRLVEHPEDARWWTWLPVLRTENLLVGSCGYMGRPNALGEVEIGYEIAAHRRGQGLATEAVLALVQHAFAHPEVQKVIAHTLPELNPSAKILRSHGFQQLGEKQDPDEGTVWRWELPRAAYLSHQQHAR